MKKYLKILLFLTFLTFYHNTQVICQDLNYTQFFNAPLNLNPAFTGINEGLKVRFQFRDQWPKLPVDFKSFYFSADIGDRNLPGAGGLGIVVSSDNPGYGLINTLNLGLTFAVNLPLTELSLIQVGMKAGLIQKKINWNDLTFSDQLDNRLGAIYNTDYTNPESGKRIAPDFAVGGIVLFTNPNGNLSGDAGVAVDHLFRPDISFYETEDSKISRKWTIHGDFYFSQVQRGGDPMKFLLATAFINQDKFNSLQVGLNILKYNIYLGGWYRGTLNGPAPNNIIAVTAGCKIPFAPDLTAKFMYSYDIQISGALQGTGGAHEISLVLDMPNVSIFGNGFRSGHGGYILPNKLQRHSELKCFEF